MTLNRPNETITYTLKNDLEIESAEDIPTFAVKVTGTNKLILKGENTYEFNDQSSITNLEVDEKATLNYKGGTITSLTNKKGATLNILKDVTVGTGNTIATLTNSGTMTIAKDVMLDNKATGFTHTGADAVLENNGTLKLSENWTNNATLNNTGVIAIANSKTLTNNADCTINMNDGYFWYQSGTATTAITNNGTIVLAKAADVFMFGATTPAADDTNKMANSGTVSLVATASDNVDYSKISEVTAITLTGEGWNKDNISKARGSMETLTFKDATADLKGCGTTDYDDVDFTLEGTTVLNNSATDAEEVNVKSLNVAKNANVTLNGAKQTLKLAEGITVNEGATATNNSYIAMVNNKTITLNGTLNNAGTIDVLNGTIAAVSIDVTINAKGTFNNSGNFATANYNTSAISVTGKANFTGGKAYGTVNLLGSNTTTGDVIATIAPTKATSGVGINTLATAGCKEIIVEESVTPSNPLNCPQATIYVLASGILTLQSGNNTVGNMVIGDDTAVLAGTTTGSILKVNGTFTVELAKWTIGTQITTINAANINATCDFKANELTTIQNLDGSKTWAYDSVTNRWKLN